MIHRCRFYLENIEIWFIVSDNFTGLVFTKLGINVILNDTCVVSEKKSRNSKNRRHSFGVSRKGVFNHTLKFENKIRKKSIFDYFNL